MDTLEQRRKGVDLSWYRETEKEIKQLSGNDRFGNWWSSESSYDHRLEMYAIRMTSQICLFDGSWWFIAAKTPDEAIDVLIADGKYKPEEK